MNKKELVALIFEAMNTRNFSNMEQYISDNIQLDFPGIDLAVGKKRVLLVLNIILRKYSELKFNVSDILLENNKAVAIWTNQGLARTGESYSNTGLTLVEFENEKIKFLSDYFKDTSFTNPK